MKKNELLHKICTVPNIAAFCFFLLTIVTAGQYGFYGDELYYIACSKHMDFGYVDHPPLVALFTLISRWIFGESLFGLRFFSGLAGAATVFLSVQTARMLGGGKFSQSFAALSVCFAPAFPALSSFFSMNPIDIMLVTLFIILFLKTIENPSPIKWITLGVVFGIGLLNKYTFLVLGFSLFFSLIITKQRILLKSPWIYLSGVIAFLIFLPHILWQVNNGFPTLEFMHNVTKFKNLSLSPITFFSQLILGLNPLTLPLWLSGLLYLLFSKNTKEYHFLAWMAVLFLAIYLIQNSKFYYVLPVFPLLFSSGAVVVEQLSQKFQKRLFKPVVVSTLIISGTLLMPLAVPMLPVEMFVSYSKTLGLWNSIRMEKGEGDTLPLHFVHRFGWEELTDTVAKIYSRLPEDEKKNCAILASWYGIAGAIDHFGYQYQLPNAICARNNYWMWGTQNYSGEVVLSVGYNEQFLNQFFDSVEPVSYFEHQYAYDIEIFLCKKPKTTLAEMWQRLKNFI